jgi:hypothetical protein
MELGDPSTTEREQRSRLDEALDTLDTTLTDLITTMESGGLDQLTAPEKLAVWKRFETVRNRLPLIDHQLIGHGEANDLAKTYCSSTMTQFMVRVLQLSRGRWSSHLAATHKRLR